MAVPFFAEFGWEPLILKIDPEQQEGIKDPFLCRTIPEHIRTWQAGCLPLKFTRWLGVRSVGLRSLFHLAKAGDRIIQQESPLIAFFSTTMFEVMTLGRYWYHRYRLPYVLDFQDPWLSDYLGWENTREQSVKRRIANLGARVLEPLAVRHAAHVVSVSPAYAKTLCRRYVWLTESMFTVLPFGAAETDMAQARNLPVRQTVYDPGDGKRHWVYVGRGGADMAFALTSLFKSLRRELDAQPNLHAELRLHFIGTDYAPKVRATKTVEPLAREAGLADVVIEQTDRVPYFEALQCLLDADALIVPGSDDPGYTASKIYPYILAAKPLLAIFHADSSVVNILNETKAGTVVSFRSGETVEIVADRIAATGWLRHPTIPATDWSEFESYTAREMTRRQCAIFDSCVL